MPLRLSDRRAMLLAASPVVCRKFETLSEFAASACVKVWTLLTVWVRPF
jgi:hypothetical protein